jgi:hypothetical protein
MTALPRWAGLTLGAAVGVAAARGGGLGTGVLLAAPLFGLCALAGVIAGELLVRPPAGPTRTATIEVRRIRDYLPRRTARLVAAAGVLLLLVSVATTVAGTADDQGRAGRTLVSRCTPDSWEARSPWPGLFYTGPLWTVVVIGLLMTAVALRVIARRPRSGHPDDDARRDRSARTVTGATGILLAIPLAGVSLTAGGALLATTSCGRPSDVPVGWTLIALSLAALVMVSWCLAEILLPVRRAR